MSEQPPSDNEATLVSLEALNQRLKTIVEAKTQGKSVWVRGVATDVNRTRGGHVHLRLRQGKYGLGCVVFRSIARALPFWIEDGQTLLVQGEIAVDAVWGELQIVAHHAELETTTTGGSGIEALKVQVKAAGWLESDHKRPLPRPPQVIGLIAGEQSKARTDVIGSLKDAGVETHVVLETALMQGPEAVKEIKSALAVLNAKPDVDVIVIARGGGSQAELAIFNDCTLAQAIVESRAPVITAVGHRQDESLADLVADSSVPTPSLVGSALAGRPAVRWEVIAVTVLVVVIVLLFLLARTMGWW